MYSMCVHERSPLPAFAILAIAAFAFFVCVSGVAWASSCAESPTCTNDPTAPDGVWDPHEPWSSIDACIPFGYSSGTPFRTCDVLIYDPMLASTFIRGRSVVHDSDLRWVFACSDPKDGPPEPFMAFWSRTPDPAEGTPSTVQVTFSAAPDPCPCLEAAPPPPVTVTMGRHWDSSLGAFRMWRFSGSGAELDPILDLIFHTRLVAVEWNDPDLGRTRVVYDFDDDSDPTAMIPLCPSPGILHPCRTHGWAFVRTVSTLPCFERYIERTRTLEFAPPPAGDYCPQCGVCYNVSGDVCDPKSPNYDPYLCCLCGLCSSYCTAYNIRAPLSPPHPSIPVWLEWDWPDEVNTDPER